MSASASTTDEDFAEAAYGSSQYALASQNDILRNKLEDLNKRYTILQKSHDSEMIRLENSIQNLHKKHTEQLNVLNSTIKSLQEALSNSKTESSQVPNGSWARTTNSHTSLFESKLNQNPNIILQRLQSLEFENQRLSVELENQIEFNNILQNKIEKMPEYENAMKLLQSDETDSISNTEKQINDLNKKKINHLKNEIKTKNEMISNLQATIDEMKSKYDTTKTELDYKTIQNAKLEQEIAKKKQDQSNHENLISEISKNQTEDLEKVNKTFDIFNEFIQNKDKQIVDLTNQRDSLITIVKQFETIESASEESLRRAILDNERLEMQLDELQLNYQQSLEESREIINQLFDNLSNTYDFEFSSDKTPYENVVSLIEKLTSQSNITTFKDDFEPIVDITSNHSEYESQPTTVNTVNSEKEKRMIVLGQFENAVRFIHSLANSSNKVISQFDFQDRTLILTQCVRMSKFIEEEIGDYNLPTISSLFDPLSVESNAKLFYKFVDGSEDALKQPPLRELYAMFLATLEVNFLLFNKMNELTKIQNSLKDNQQKLQEQRRSKEDSYREIYHGQCQKLRDLAKVARSYTQLDESESDPFEILISLIESHKKLLKVHKNDLQSIKKLKSVIFSMTSNMISNSQNTTEINDNQSHKSETKLLYHHIKKLKSENETLKNDINHISSEKDKILIKSKSEIDRLKEQLNQSRVTYEELYSKYSQIEIENRSFEDEIVKLTQKIQEMEKQTQNHQKEKQEMNEKIERQKEAERKVKEKNKNLAKRIQEIENSNQTKHQPEKEIKPNNDIENLSNQIQEKQEEISHLQAELTSMKNEKMVLQMSMKKLMLQNKRNQCLIDQFTSQIQQRENQAKLKCEAQIYQSKLENEKIIKDLKESITSGIKKLHDILKDKFDIQVSEDKHTIPDLTSILYRVINEKHVQEINSLNLDSKVNAVDLIQQLRNEVDANRATIDQLSHTNEQLETEMEEIFAKNSKLSECQIDLTNWISWARSIYRLVTEGQVAPSSIPDLRCALEESMLTAIGHRKMRRKLEILRTEKKVLITPSIRNTLNAIFEQSSIPNRKFQKTSFLPKVPSVRPITLAFMFLRRLQQYGGCAPSAYKCGGDDDSTILDDDSIL